MASIHIYVNVISSPTHISYSRVSKMPRPNKTSFKRKSIPFNDKLKILERVKKGEKISAIAKSLGLNEATVRTIKKAEIKIKENVDAGCARGAKRSTRARDIDLVKMEKALYIWIEDCAQKKVPLDGNILKQKALKIFQHLKISNGTIDQQGKPFSASSGWFENFRKRYDLHNLKLGGERASADTEAAEKYPAEFAKIVEEGGYTAEQVFNADETGLYWKKMPSRTYVAKELKSVPGHKVAKERVSLLLCSNASGNCLMKPLFINRSLNPRALKGVDKTLLPVYWEANKKAWMTAYVFENWFYKCFVPDAEKFLMEKNLAFKVLLILDNASVHPENLIHSNVKVIFLPPNTTSLIQPLDQGAISTFKAYYIRKAFEIILEKLEGDDEKTIVEAWKEFSIYDCVKMVELSRKEMKVSTLNGCWKNLWPEAVLSKKDTPPAEDEMTRIISVAKRIGGDGFVDMTIEDINELLDDPLLNEEELIQLVDEPEPLASGIENTDDDIAENMANLTIDDLVYAIELSKKLCAIFNDKDNLLDRSNTFQKQVQQCMAPYKDLLEGMKNAKAETMASSSEKVPTRPTDVATPMCSKDLEKV